MQADGTQYAVYVICEKPFQAFLKLDTKLAKCKTKLTVNKNRKESLMNRVNLYF